MTDSELLLRLRDRSALAELYDRHAPTLFAVALRIAGDRARATEVVEELFLALGDGRELYDPVFGSPAAWLIRQTREYALAEEAQKSMTSVDKEEPTPRLLVEQAFYRGEGVEALARAYSLTPERVRSMLCDGMAEVRKQLRPGEWR
jgi:DNA-directed RNA polymerase specialized sigma24 family protein